MRFESPKHCRSVDFMVDFGVIKDSEAGAVFIHGLFFAHEAESVQTMIDHIRPTKLLAVGDRVAQYWPKSEMDIKNAPIWERY